jgi:uncharacterized protein involved in tolerance to divalent cations
VITVFDIATKEELKEMFCSDDEDFTEELKNSLIEHRRTSPSNNYADLASLYAGRGDIEKCKEYLALIEDEGILRTRGMLISKAIHGLD